MSALDDDFKEVRRTLSANGVMRYGRYERDNTDGALDALKRLEQRVDILLSLTNRDIEGQYQAALVEAGLTE